jgi:hypothetical protein
MAVDIAAPIARYADRFHRAVGDGHHVASPLGAWLLLALAAPAATGPAREALVEVLGVDVDQARAVAAALLAEPHPAVASAIAAWRSEIAGEALDAWFAGLPATVETGAMPSQAEADEWARERTLGLIDKFPLALTREVVLVLASALATKVSWQIAFDLVPAAELGSASQWSGRLTQVLRSPRRHHAFIATTERAGDVAVHTATSTDGLAVTSVIASAEVAAADVLAAAHEVVLGSARPRSLFDLPLGDCPLWTLTEQPSPSGHDERVIAVVPTWSARSDHRLETPVFGFPAAAEALIGLLPPGAYDFVAKQSAMARYSRTGFEAAAVTAIGIRATALHSGPGVRRTAVLRFGHPYAVVAVAQGTESWDGVPVFSAWVAEPEDATE